MKIVPFEKVARMGKQGGGGGGETGHGDLVWKRWGTITGERWERDTGTKGVRNGRKEKKNDDRTDK
jgi:hypothetical protein